MRRVDLVPQGKVVWSDADDSYYEGIPLFPWKQFENVPLGYIYEVNVLLSDQG